MQAVEAIIDPFPIAALQDRYSIGQAQVYNRMEKLGIKPEVRGKLSAEQVQQLDEYDKYLKEPKPEISNLTMAIRKEQGVVENHPNSNHTIELLAHLLEKVILKEPVRSPLFNFEELNKASLMEFILPTSKVAELIGYKPRGLGTQYGCYLIERCSKKVGRESGWLIVKKKVKSLFVSDNGGDKSKI